MGERKMNDVGHLGECDAAHTQSNDRGGRVLQFGGRVKRRGGLVGCRAGGVGRERPGRELAHHRAQLAHHGTQVARHRTYLARDGVGDYSGSRWNSTANTRTPRRCLGSTWATNISPVLRYGSFEGS